MGNSLVVEYILTDKARTHAFGQLKGKRVPYTMWDDLWQMLCLKAVEKGGNVKYPITWCHITMLNLIRELFNPKRKLGKHWIAVNDTDTEKLVEGGFMPDIEIKILAEEVARRYYPQKLLPVHFGDDFVGTKENNKEKIRKHRFLAQAKKNFVREENIARLNSLARKVGVGR